MRDDLHEDDLDAELRAYLDLLIEEKIRAGMPRAEAARAARIELGGIEQVKEEVRAVSKGAFMNSLMQDAKYGVRMLARNPAFALVAILALALGIGASTAIFSVVYGVLLRPLPFPGQDRIATVFVRFAPQNTEHGTMCIADFFDWKAGNHAFEDPAIFRHAGYRYDITGASEPEQVLGTQVTANFFAILKVNPILGRTFAPDEDHAAAAPLAVIGESLWRRHFGGDRGIVGRMIRLNGAEYNVVGVMPASFQFPPPTEVWTNLRMAPPTRRGPYPFIGLGRLRPGMTMAQAQAETNAIGREISARWPGYQKLTLPVVPIHDFLVGDARPALAAMLGAVLFVLLIAVVNVANLLLARATVRQREMALRASLGAGRARLIRQALTESVLLALAGGLAGMAVAWIGIHVLQATNPGQLPRIEDVRLDARVLAFAVLLSLAAGVLFGTWPALKTSRTNVHSTLKEAGRGAIGGRRSRAHAVLVVSEIALSFVLLAGAGLLLRSFISLQRVQAGFGSPPERILSMSLSPPRNRYNDWKTVPVFFDRVVERVQALPGVESAGLSDSLPPDHQADYDTFQIAGQRLPPGQSNPAVTSASVGPDYFATLGIPLKEGRPFTTRDRYYEPDVVIVSETFARTFLPGRQPVGAYMKASGFAENPPMRIVGVVGDVKYTGLDKNSAAAYYRPYTQNYQQRMYLVVRSRVAAGLASEVSTAIRDIDRDVAITDIRTLQDLLYDSVSQPRFRTALIALFGAVALLLSGIGIYGVISYSVAQRTNEIGVRMALGAPRASVLREIVGSGALLAAAGALLGCGGALALTRLLASLLYATSAADALTLATVTVILLSVAVLASLIPALRATRIDPVAALRYE